MKSMYVFDHVRGTAYTVTGWPVTSTNGRICPDLLRYEQIGAADNLRGRVVRAFFWLLRIWPA